jgi:hypothetical protein
VLGAWGAACALLAGALVLLGLVRFHADAYAKLRTIPEPAGWQQWPVLPSLGGYALDHDPGACVGHGLLCGWTNVLLSERGLWLRRGVSLDRLYGQSLNADPPSVRGSGKMRVVSGPGVAIVAFETGTTSGSIAFRHDGTWTIMASLVAALAALLFAWLYASRQTRDATRARAARVLRRVFFVALALGVLALLRGCMIDLDGDVRQRTMTLSSPCDTSRRAAAA